MNITTPRYPSSDPCNSIFERHRVMPEGAVGIVGRGIGARDDVTWLLLPGSGKGC
jgi:hypothetical protein